MTSWYEATKLKIAEQAAAESILRQLADTPITDAQPAAAASPTDPLSGPPSGPNPAIVLNELKQAGLLQATGYEQLDQTGPSHQPTFTVAAWATITDGRTLRADPAHAPSKKAAQRAAASSLLALLVDEGITGR